MFLAVAAALIAMSPRPAPAQVGAATDIITGVVTGADGQPIQDATVEAYSLETQVTRRARTDARGRFTILFPDGGGQYRMTARAIGMNSRIEIIQRHADEDRLVWNPRLGGGVVTLDEINVRGAQVVRGPDAPTPGSTERVLGPEQVLRLPVDNTDLMSLAGLTPGVLTLSATDSSAASFSVAGMGPEANALTLDGLLFGNSSIPQEGLRQTRVITSTYDVSRGQFSGGMISSTTRGGSNVVQGSSTYQLREDDLAYDPENTPFTQGFTQHVISGGIGGPIARDKLFLFGSFQGRLRSDPQQTLLSARETDFTRLGVHPDSVARFMAIVNGLGVPANSTPSRSTRSSDNLSGLARLDWVLSNTHTVTLRGDWRGTSQDPARLGTLALPQTGGQFTSSGGGVMATLTSRFGATVLNEFRGYWQGSRSDGDGFTRLPQGRVVVASDLPDSSRGVSTLVFGGNSGFPTRQRTSSFEASNELSWMPGTGAHRIKAGASVLREDSRNVTGSNQLGTFSYNSLADLENGNPASFRRTVDVTERDSRSYRWGAYLGDVWMVTRPFQLTYGVRLEGSSFGNLPDYNPAIDSVFGRRTDRLPEETHLSPRMGFSWQIGGRQMDFQRGIAPQPPSVVIRGGVGEFRSQPPTGMAAQARSATGLASSTGDLFCVGSAVPEPTWSQYWSDPGAIPSECASTGGPAPTAPQAPRTVVTLADGFEASRAWRGSLGVEKRLTQLFRLNLDASLSRGVAQSGFYDLNLDRATGFTLAAEGDRPVFVAPSDIAPASGTPRFNASRVDSSFGQVLEARSSLRSRTEQLTAGLGGVLGRGILLNLSYTWQRSRDQATGLRGGSTAADPNAVEWARSDFERRHNFLATVTYPLSQSIEFTSIGRLTSGAPYTPMVGGDVNGDGSRNDRAYIFAAGAGDPVSEGMQRLLAGASGSVRECLTAQLGRVAGRNTCTGPWQYSLDFQLNWRPAFWGLNRRVTVSAVTQNFLRGLDELLHGAGGARGWGLATRPDNTLLYVTGFDPNTQRYSYQVNERFGSTAGSATAFRPPFQLGVQVRLSIGPDRMRQALDAMRAGGGRGGVVVAGPGAGLGGTGGFRGPALNPAEIIARLEQALPNPAGVALQMRDSLGLDSSQVILLSAERDSLARLNGARIDSLRNTFGRVGNNPSPQQLMQLMPALGPLFTETRTQIARSLATVRAILTEPQWEKLPENVRNVQAGGPRIMMGPGQRGPGEVPRPGDGPRRP